MCVWAKKNEYTVCTFEYSEHVQSHLYPTRTHTNDSWTTHSIFVAIVSLVGWPLHKWKWMTSLGVVCTLVIYNSYPFCSHLGIWHSALMCELMKCGNLIFRPALHGADGMKLTTRTVNHTFPNLAVDTGTHTWHKHAQTLNVRSCRSPFFALCGRRHTRRHTAHMFRIRKCAVCWLYN